MIREQFKATEAVSGAKDTNALLLLRNRMQKDLAKRNCADCSNEHLLDWVLEELSPRFRVLLKKEPDLLLRYEKDPEAALAAAEKEMHLEQETVGRP
jgi:hypothetical protein